MSAKDYTASLRRLVELVPPPEAPLENDRPPASLLFADGRPVTFPPDYLALTGIYGSGSFDHHDEVGMIAELHNPRAAAFSTYVEREHAFLREYKRDEGGGYADYEIFPDAPGLLQWGRAEGRKAYFWLTDGKPEQWPLVVMWDFEFVARYEMPVVVFLKQLAAGELDAQFLAVKQGSLRLDPTRVRFVPRRMRSG